jgi:protein-S-isoprenylcysteine O-methyltransferase Ste14
MEIFLMSLDARVILRVILGFVFMCVFLFVPAGTIRWTEAWIYIVMQFSFSISISIWLRKRNPELLKDRLALMKRSAKGWDKVLMLSTTPFFFALLIIPGLDAVRYQWSYVSGEVKLTAFIVMFFALLSFFIVLRENTFLSRVVEIQEDKGHHVITTGPYRLVRHPMYVGVITLFFAIPLALGSLYGLLPGVGLAIAIIIRTYLEDKTLHKELPGYPEYSRKTRYRLLPGIW